MTDGKRALVDLAYANATLISRLMRSERVVEAARRLVSDPGRVNRMWELEEEVAAYEAAAPV